MTEPLCRKLPSQHKSLDCLRCRLCPDPAETNLDSCRCQPARQQLWRHRAVVAAWLAAASRGWYPGQRDFCPGASGRFQITPNMFVCCNLLILWPVTVGLWHQRNHVQALWRNNQECHTLSQHCFASSWCVYSQRPTGCRRFIFFDLGAYLSSDFLRPPIKYSEDLKNFQKNKYTSNQHYVNPLQVPEAHITTK